VGAERVSTAPVVDRIHGDAPRPNRTACACCSQRVPAVRFGCIADDFTGATDLCSSLARAGLRTSLIIDLAKTTDAPLDDDVIVVPLKSRAARVEEAVSWSLAAFEWLKRVGCEKYYFKYCSTFDSTPEGNIGPVLDALMDQLGVPATIVCPAHPEQRRTVYSGNLFVGDVLLSRSPMATHPINPMQESDLRRLLGRQTSRSVGLIPYEIVDSGEVALREEFDHLVAEGFAYLVLDALKESHLLTIARAFVDLPLLSGGAGVGWALGRVMKGNDANHFSAHSSVPVSGPTAILAGSSSVATRAQIDRIRGRLPSFQIDPLAIHTGETSIGEILEWAVANLTAEGLLIYASTAPERVREVQMALGPKLASSIVESTLADLAVGLVSSGIRRIVVAGGETSAAVVQSLELPSLGTCGDLEPGVPWMLAPGEPLLLALKSGNFGSTAFFENALQG
jgi:3-dehydrotetronate 4-kinase